MCQGSLLEDSGESCTTWPRQGTWDRGYVWELPTSAHLTDEIESSSLLPTPNAYESTPTDEYTSEVREHLDDPHRRLYLPGRKWHAQRTLSRIAGALLPTPGANDSTGPEGPTRQARQEEGDTGGPALRDIAHLLPTPTGQDAANTAGPSQHERNSLPLNTVVTELLPTPNTSDQFGRTPVESLASGQRPSGQPVQAGLRDIEALLPTPSASDGTGGRVSSKETFERGKRPSGAKAEVTLQTAVTHKLLPTPQAADGQRTSEKHMGDNPTLVGALLPTPTSQDARQNALNEAEAQRNPATMWATMGRVQSGDHTSPRFGGGRQSSPDQHPDQLTLEDA